MKRTWHWIVTVMIIALCLMIVTGLVLSLYLLWRMQALGDPARTLSCFAVSRPLFGR